MPDVPDPEELEELSKRTFTKRVALCAAVYAVALAIGSLGGSNAMKGTLLAQQQASDQWAFYQAKVLRQHLYRTQRFMVEATLAERGAAMTPEARQQFEALRDRFASEEERYGQEKGDIEEQAHAFEAERDVGRAQDPYFDYAEVCLQIALVMASLSILAGSRPVFYFSLVLAIFGAVLTVNGFTLWVSTPPSEVPAALWQRVFSTPAPPPAGSG